MTSLLGLKIAHPPYKAAAVPLVTQLPKRGRSDVGSCTTSDPCCTVSLSIIYQGEGATFLGNQSCVFNGSFYVECEPVLVILAKVFVKH